MNVRDLKKILENVDDDLEVFVSPLVEMILDDKELTLMPTPYHRYKLSVACQSGTASENFKNFLLLGFGNVNYGETEEEKEFIN